MSVSTEVQRTLVKSPPELWSELSNPETLGRHLAELGEIRITSVEPETKVKWESEGASGVVHLKQSGWGTKVTLSVTRNPPAAEEQSGLERVTTVEPAPLVEPKSEPIPEPIAAVEPEPIEAEPDSEPTAVETEPEPAAVVELDPEPAAVEPEPIAQGPEPIAPRGPELGFFARLFRRRRARPAIADSRHEPAVVLKPEVEPDPEPEIEVVALATPEPIYPPPPLEPAADLAAELEAVEAQMTQETTELLTGVLDRLGAAHHRPFSRG